MYSNFTSSTSSSTEPIDFFFSNNDFFWSLPGFHTITSPFGPRKSPTSGSSSNHSGIDIAAPEGTNIHSIIDGVITFTGFNGANRLYYYNAKFEYKHSILSCFS